MTTSESAYITTPIYYVNDKPHIGHAYTTTLCDVWARAMRSIGRDVFFLTGTDEHGLKVEKSAKERGISPKELADENAAEFRNVMKLFNLTNDDFIRTTEPRHEEQVGKFIEQLKAQGDIYLGEFEGWYDEGQEEYYTETKAKELEYKSPISGKPLVRATETNYYFRLSSYQEKLEKWFAENPAYVRPEARRNEVLGRLREGLQDVPVTRTNFSWGIPFPGDKEHVIYVWIDALMNYATALGMADPTHSDKAKYWPATYHVIGKEILWFHAVIWPALLMALELPQPKCVYAHSFWIREGKKMSKSLGNFVDLAEIEKYIQKYGLDALRWYLVNNGPLGATDADFQAQGFHETYSTDLVNTVGNCASRTTAMIDKYFDGAVPEDGDHVFEGWDLRGTCDENVAKWTRAIEDFDLSGACSAAMSILRTVDGFIHATEPFKLVKDEAKRGEVGSILYRSIESVRIASLLLWPVLPERMEDLWNALSTKIDPSGGNLARDASWGGFSPGTQVEKVALFPRIESVPAAG
jgi:methionine--tRNA ligase